MQVTLQANQQQQQQQQEQLAQAEAPEPEPPVDTRPREVLVELESIFAEQHKELVRRGKVSKPTDRQLRGFLTELGTRIEPLLAECPVKTADMLIQICTSFSWDLKVRRRPTNLPRQPCPPALRLCDCSSPSADIPAVCTGEQADGGGGRAAVGGGCWGRAEDGNGYDRVGH